MADNLDFVVESTPVLANGKRSESTLNNGDDDQGIQDFNFGFTVEDDDDDDAVIWDSEKTEVLADLVGEGDLAPRFVDREGNQESIIQFPFYIGRGQDCDMVLSGKGISRRHAEIIFESGRFVIKDLESLNGIRVNGYKVSRVILEDQDEVKIGDVFLTFDIGKGAARNKPAENISASADDKGFDFKAPNIDSKKFVKPVLFSSVMVLLVFGGLYLFQMFQTQSKVRVVSQSTPQTRPAPAASAGPVQASPQANVTANSNSGQVSSSPTPVASSAPLASPIASAVPEKTSPVNTNIFEQAEVKAPPKPKKPAPSTVAKSSGKSTQANQLIAKAQSQYMNGLVDQWLSDARKLLNSGAVLGSSKQELEQTRQQYQALFDQFQSGLTAKVNGNIPSMITAYEKFIASETSLFKGEHSYYYKEAAPVLSSHYVKQASQLVAANKNHDAYRMWEKAAQLDRRPEALAALANADTKSKQLYRKGLRLEYVNATQAKAHWQQVLELVPPGSEYYQKAKEKIGWYDQWGQ